MSEVGGTADQLTAGIKRALEQKFLCVYGLRGAVSNTGEEYVEIKSEGSDLTEAAAALAFEIASYAAGKAGTLYWRIEPELDADGSRWRGYARLLISGAAIKWRTFAQYAIQKARTE